VVYFQLLILQLVKVYSNLGHSLRILSPQRPSVVVIVREQIFLLQFIWWTGLVGRVLLLGVFVLVAAFVVQLFWGLVLGLV